jgi:threonine/homoserine/homoserine lactone efflux protein
MRGLGWLRRGLLTNLLNPKIGVFYVTFLPQFVPTGVGAGLWMLLLAALHVAYSMVWFAVLIAATLPLSRVLKRPAVVRWIDRITGGVLIGFGARLALSRR